MFPGCEPRILSVSSDHTMRQWNVKTGGVASEVRRWVRTTWDRKGFLGIDVLPFLYVLVNMFIIVVARCQCVHFISFLCTIYIGISSFWL